MSNNKNNEYLYIALSCVIQSAVKTNEWNAILQGKRTDRIWKWKNIHYVQITI